MQDAKANGGRGSVLDRVLGAAPLAAAARRALRGRLRILGYHDVPDPDAFARQVDLLTRHFRPVSGAEVVSALAGRTDLPPGAVWVTFDDGRPSVVANGLPVLRSAAVPATLFVCPGLVEAGEPLWTHQVRASPSWASVEGRELRGAALAAALKRVDDAVRRSILAGLEPGDVADDQRALRRAELERWLDAGFEVGNHTWDHPCLDRCSPQQQAEQVAQAHAWLVDLTGRPPELFAYPNGDWTAATAGVLAELGYGAAPLFDHGLASLDDDRFALPRLRLDADAPMARARAITSGLHSALFGLRRTPSA